MNGKKERWNGSDGSIIGAADTPGRRSGRNFARCWRRNRARTARIRDRCIDTSSTPCASVARGARHRLARAHRPIRHPASRFEFLNFRQRRANGAPGRCARAAPHFADMAREARRKTAPPRVASMDGKRILADGPYDTRRDAVEALTAFEREQARGIAVNKRLSGGRRAVFGCACRGAREDDDGAVRPRCEFSAVIMRRSGKRDDEKWYLTKYVAHTMETCEGRPRMTIAHILADDRVRDLCLSTDGKVSWRAIAALVKDLHGVDVPERTCSRAREVVLRGNKGNEEE